ncbi:MAG: HD domain-containing protein [Clostridium sp.]|nr:HD domain-containing protein [Clostridium sp.]
MKRNRVHGYRKKYGGAFLSMVMMAVFLWCGSKANAEKTDIYGEDGGYLAVLYDNSSGLPTSEANAIVQSPDGFIWIGGYSGLVRYDGDEFYRFDATTGLTSVVSLYVDAQGRLWIGTNDRGVALYEYGEFTFWGKEEGLLSDSIRRIAEDRDGNLILATTQGLAYIDDAGELHLIDDERINGQYVCDLSGDAQGMIYGVTLDGDVFLLDGLSVSLFFEGAELPYDVPISVTPVGDRTGVVYLGTEEDYIVRTDLTGDVRQYEKIMVSPRTNINHMGLWDNKLWICADNGIGYVDEQDCYREVGGLPLDNSVDGMITDREGNLWFVSSRQGVMKIVKNRFTNISEQADLGKMVINSTCLYREKLYVGTDSGLVILDGEYQRVEDELTALMEKIRIRCIKADSQGNLWLCTFSDRGLVCLRPDGSIVSYREENGLNSNRVRTMLELENGDIAVATSGGVNILRGGEIVQSYGSGDGISNTEILSLCEAPDGALYAGSDGNGIYVISPDGIRNLTDRDGLYSEVILMMKKDPERDGYWIVTGNSLAYMEEEQIKVITSFPYSNNFDVFFGEGDRIWVVSSNGLYSVSGKALADDNVQEYAFYNSDSGMHCSATANARSHITPDGTLYIAGSESVMRICINDTSTNNGDVKLAVPFVKMDEETVYFREGDTLTIPRDCTRVTIYGYALTYTLNDPLIRYQLKGFSDEEVTLSRSQFSPVSYTNLAGKEYTFVMSVIDSGSGEVVNEISVTLVKEKKLTEYLAFRLSLVLMLLLLAAFIVLYIMRRRVTAYKEREAQNRKFMNEVIAAFAKAIDIKDKYTNGHSSRVAEYSKLLAQKMGYSEEEVERIHHIALLHDIGKIAVPDEILNKPMPLTDEEYEVMKRHAQDGYDILQEIHSYPDMALGAGFHHESLDGTGYPNGCKRDEIPFIARIVAVADTFDAMNSTRPYRKKMPMEEIIEELKRVSGTRLEPDIVKLMLELIEEQKLV